MKISAMILLLALLSACATRPPQSADGDVDPFELQDPIKPLNKAVFGFNLRADRYVIKPVAETYHICQA